MTVHDPQLRLRWVPLHLYLAVALGACMGQIGDSPRSDDGTNGATSGGTSIAGSGGSASTGGSSTTGGAGGAGGVGSGAAAGSGGAMAGGAAGAAGAGAGGSGGTGGGPTLCQDPTIHAGRAPLRRLTRFEYNNTVRDLFGDTTQPANVLPPDAVGNGFGNDADALSVSSLLAEQYIAVAEGIAARATATPAALAKWDACASNVTATTEEACTAAMIGKLAPAVNRRALATGEADALVALAKTARSTANATFATAMASVIQALLLAPDFLYRIELGAPDAANPSVKRPTGDEMATRLSYLFFGTTPDATLRAAANAGTLATGQGVLAQATRMLDDPRSHAVVRFFFDNLLPINGLSDIVRDKTKFPTFSPAVGAAMGEETQRFLEYEIFSGSGTWRGALTAPYTFVNDTLAAFYGISGVSGAEFRKVPLPDTSRRLGLLTQAGVMTGTVTTNQSNPVLRGTFIVNKLMCRSIALPTDPVILDQVKIPDDTSGKTARERFSKHSAQPVCATCHQFLDPMGFALENYDPVGLFRTEENGVVIDASGSVPGMSGAVSGPVELVQKLAENEEVHACFASHWLNFAYGRRVGADRDDECARASVEIAFRNSGYNVKKLLLALTQTDEFLYFAGSQ